MSHIRSLAVGATLLLASASVVFAQPGEGPPPGRPGGPGMMPMNPAGGMIRLLRLEAVQKDIEMVDDQKTQLRELGNEMRGERPPEGLRDLSREERRARMDEFRKQATQREAEVMKKLEAILLPQQMGRLKEIQLQIQGVFALANPAVAEKLAVTEAQKEQFASIRKEFESQRSELAEKWRDMSREEQQEAMKKSRGEVEAKMLQILTEDQKAQFETMKGKKIDIDPTQLFGGPGGPGREGRGQRRSPPK